MHRFWASRNVAGILIYYKGAQMETASNMLTFSLQQTPSYNASPSEMKKWPCKRVDFY